MIKKTFNYQGLVYRGHNPKWSYSPTSGEGAARHGGRFNPKKTAALYTSESFATAWAEAQQAFPFKSQPLTLCSYQVSCESVLDLTNPEVLKQTGYSLSDLACPYELMLSNKEIPPTWRLAEELIQAGVAAIRVPSFAPAAEANATNIVFWKWGDSEPNKVVVIDDDKRLPSNPRLIS